MIKEGTKKEASGLYDDYAQSSNGHWLATFFNDNRSKAAYS
jgi:hypothetical protein